MSELRTKLNNAVKDAMRAKDKERLATLRLATSALKQIEVDERIELDDSRILVVLDKMIKQRKDAAEQFTQGGRDDLSQQELREIEVLQEFLPAALDDAELETIIKAAIEESGASSMRDMGNAMALIKPQIQGRADIGKVSQQVKALLG